LDNDDDPADIHGVIDPTSVELTAAPGHGFAEIDPRTGTITYTPAPGFVGTDSFTYLVCDTGEPVECDTATVTVVVTEAGAALRGRVWFETDGDGIREPGEQGIGGVVVVLERTDRDDLAPIRTVSAVDGSYAFAGLEPGTYRVSIDESTLPLGVRASFDRDGLADLVTVVTIARDTTLEDVDFGVTGAATLVGRLFEDLDGDGVFEPGEPGVGEIHVTVRHGGADGLLDTADDIVVSGTAAADGTYRVDGLPGGLVRVEVASEGPDGLYLVGGGSALVTLVSGSETRLDFPYRTPEKSAPPLLVRTGAQVARLFAVSLLLVGCGLLLVAAARRRSAWSARER
ncbi:MAG: Ig-like domain-containing protein, partial [Chloroflexota bacterium]|nr:Ig-like domain-containing protein [Chloroflexota bacterium]